MFFEGISAYGLMIAVGMLSGGTLACLLARHKNLSVDNVIILSAYMILFGMAGAKILYLFIHRGSIDWANMLSWEYASAVLGSGFVFYGGLIGGLLGLLFTRAVHKINAREYIKVIIPAVPLAHGFGRIGCHLAGCCYGFSYEGLLRITYKNPLLPIYGTHRFPVQLLEAGINFILAAVTAIMVYKGKISSKALHLYLLTYSLARFLLEYLRYDTAERGGFGPFTTSQWISAGLFAAVGVRLLIRRRRAWRSRDIQSERKAR